MSAVVPTDTHGSPIEPLDLIVLRIKEAVTVLVKADDRRVRLARDLAECKRRIEAGMVKGFGFDDWYFWLRRTFPQASQKYLANEAALGVKELAQPGAIARERERVKGAMRKSREPSSNKAVVTTVQPEPTPVAPEKPVWDTAPAMPAPAAAPSAEVWRKQTEQVVTPPAPSDAWVQAMRAIEDGIVAADAIDCSLARYGATYYPQRIDLAKRCLDVLGIDTDDAYRVVGGEPEAEPEEDGGEDPKVKAAIEAHRKAIKRLTPGQKEEFWGALKMVKRKRPGSKAERWQEAVDELRDIRGECEYWIDETPENFKNEEQEERYRAIVDIDLTEIEDADFGGSTPTRSAPEQPAEPPIAATTEPAAPIATEPRTVPVGSGMPLFVAVRMALKEEGRDSLNRLAASMGRNSTYLGNLLGGRRAAAKGEEDKLRAYLAGRAAAPACDLGKCRYSSCTTTGKEIAPRSPHVPNLLGGSPRAGGAGGHEAGADDKSKV